MDISNSRSFFAGEASGSGVGGGASAVAAPGDKKDELVDAIADSTTQVSVSRRSFNPGLVNNASSNILICWFFSWSLSHQQILAFLGAVPFTYSDFNLFSFGTEEKQGPHEMPICLNERHR